MQERCLEDLPGARDLRNELRVQRSGQHSQQAEASSSKSLGSDPRSAATARNGR